MTTQTFNPQLETIVVADDIDVTRIPTRSYDLSKGDRRFSRLERAIEHADAEAIKTGIRQCVRRCPGSYTFQKLYLVQAVGS